MPQHSERTKRPFAENVYFVFLAVLFIVAVILAFGLAVPTPATAPPLSTPPAPPWPPSRPPPPSEALVPTVAASQNVEIVTCSMAVGFYRQQILSATIEVIVLWLMMVGGLIVGTRVAFRADSRDLAFDFLQKGTVSNVHQDVTTTHGRLFAASLFISGMLLLTSQYTFTLYRPWVGIDGQLYTNPLKLPQLVPAAEKVFRSFWCAALVTSVQC